MPLSVAFPTFSQLYILTFFLVGEVVEYATTDELFTMPKDKRTEDYITGRFG